MKLCLDFAVESSDAALHGADSTEASDEPRQLGKFLCKSFCNAALTDQPEQVSENSGSLLYSPSVLEKNYF